MPYLSGTSNYNPVPDGIPVYILVSRTRPQDKGYLRVTLTPEIKEFFLTEQEVSYEVSRRKY